MRTRLTIGVGLLLFGALSTLGAQDIVWRAAKSSPSQGSITLGQPSPLNAADAASPRVVRAQFGEPPPPPVFPGGGPSVGPVPDSRAIYDRGVVTNDADLGGFFPRTWDYLKRCFGDVYDGVGGAFQPGPQRQMFQSDTVFCHFSSPVTNPFYFEDPRALTEIRPFFIWQNTPNANPVFNGGNNFHYGARGSVAFTPHISLVVNRLGFTTLRPSGGVPGFENESGFSEIMIGPKVTFIRNETSGTVAAIGLTFDLSVGSANVFQDTGDLALVPYFSIAQTFGKSQYGSFNFMNTTGYTFRTDSERTEAFYSSFHLDYNIGNRFYPLVEMNWRHYTRNGGVRALNFEGNDLINFGSTTVAGRDELTLAVGSRFVINNFIQWGIAAEFNVLKNGDGRHLDQFRLTTDFIFRY